MKASLTADPYGDFCVWDFPLDKREYVCGIDVAEGVHRDLGSRKSGHKGRSVEPDYSAVIVLEVESGLHVASWRGSVLPSDLGYISAAIGTMYNDALLVPEVNGPGVAVVDVLGSTIQYVNLYISKMFGQMEGDKYGASWGWRTNKQTRPLLISRIAEAINSHRAFTRDEGLIRELRTMERDDKGVVRARYPNHDDRVLAYGMALQGRFEALHNIQPSTSSGTDGNLDPRTAAHWEKVKEERDRNSDGAVVYGPGHRPGGFQPWYHSDGPGER